MTAGMPPETAFQMAINKRAWPIMTGIDMTINRSICWETDLYDMKAHSLYPIYYDLLTNLISRGPNVLTLLLRLICVQARSFFCRGAKYFSGCGLLIWVSSLYAFPSRGRLPGDERSLRLPPATYPILYPDLVERMVVFCLSEFDTLACIPPIFLLAQMETQTRSRLGVSVSEIDR